MQRMFHLAWQQMRRELRSGEIRLLFLALTVAVTAVMAVSFFTDRLQRSLTETAHQLIGGDLVLVADQPLLPDRLTMARQLGLETAETVTFPSMVMAEGGVQLAEIKAVSARYPLRGRLDRVAARVLAADPASTVEDPVRQEKGPAAGTVWLEARLQQALAASAGDTLRLGQAQPRFSHILTHEPDRGMGFLGMAPRLLMPLTDLSATGLIQPGARVTYRLLLAGEGEALGRYRAWLEAQGLQRGERIEDAENTRPELRQTLSRAQRFLGLASLLTVTMAAVAVGLAARRYWQRHLEDCAVMRCLGAQRGQLAGMHGLQYTVLGLLAGLLGGGLGLALHYILLAWLAAVWQVALPAPDFRLLFQGIVLAWVLLLGFAVPPLLRLVHTPPLHVLRPTTGTNGGRAGTAASWAGLAGMGAYGLGAAVLMLLMVWMTGDVRLAVGSMLGFVLAGALFAALAWGILGLLGGAGIRLAGLRQGLLNLRRYRSSATVQIVTLAIGLMALQLLMVTRGELVSAWQSRLPADAPNRFILNIQADQRAALTDFFQSAGKPIALSPMLRGRLVKINEKPVSAASYPDAERAQRLVEREFNLSWRADLPVENTLVAGTWFPPEANGARLASVEAGLAATLHIQLGDTLTFMVEGQPETLRVSNLRKLAWDSMRVNFFVLTPPGVWADTQASYITSLHLSAAEQVLVGALNERFPNLTQIDVSALLAQLEKTTADVAGAVQWVFLLTLLAGLLVLYASLMSSVDERRQGLALLRALGATRGQLRQAQWVEMGLIGALSGLFAAVGASLIGGQLAQQLLELDVPAHVAWWPVMALLGAGLVLLVAGRQLSALLNTPPWSVLRGM